MNAPLHHANEERSNAVRDQLTAVEPRSLRTFTPSQAVLAKSAGVYHWTPDCRRLYDFTSGVLVSNLGHNPTAWMARFRRYMGWPSEAQPPTSAYFVAAEGGLAVFDLQGWGWWHIITGVLLIFTAIALFTGATWARVVAVILVALNALGQLFLLPVQPWWSLIVLTLDILVIYALTVHGRELKAASR